MTLESQSELKMDGDRVFHVEWDDDRLGPVEKRAMANSLEYLARRLRN